MDNFSIPELDATNPGITELENSAGIRDPGIAICNPYILHKELQFQKLYILTHLYCVNSNNEFIFCCNKYFMRV